MSTTTPPSPSAISTNAETRARMLNNVALGALIVCPIVVLLPPRKFDFYTIILLGCTAAGANQVAHSYTGRSIATRLQEPWMSESQLPAKALVTQERLKREKQERERRHEESSRGIKYGAAPESKILTELAGQGKKDAGEKRLLDKIWMGGEGADWKQKRDEREREALEEGRGYGGLIVDQIWEVWSWGKDKTEEIKEKDEQVVAAKEAKK